MDDNMKLVVAIVQDEDAGNLIDSLVKAGFGATRINTAGGFLRHGNATVLAGVEEEKVSEVLVVVRRNCTTRMQYINPMPPAMEPGEFYMPYPVEVQVGGAVIFRARRRAVRTLLIASAIPRLIPPIVLH